MYYIIINVTLVTKAFARQSIEENTYTRGTCAVHRGL